MKKRQKKQQQRVQQIQRALQAKQPPRVIQGEKLDDLLFISIRRGRGLRVVAYLLDQGADIGARDIIGYTPLHYAARIGDEAVVGLLLNRGADIHARDDLGWTPLHYAAWYGSEATVGLLLDRGADPNARNDQNHTPLHYAAWEGHEAVVRLLLDQGADINARTNLGWTPLHYAAWEGHEAIVGLLLDRGADTDVRDKDGETPLDIARRLGHQQIVRLLRETIPIQRLLRELDRLDEDWMRHISDDLRGLLEEFLCPITHQIMVEPVLSAQSGFLYQRQAIQRWLSTNKTTCPLTRKTISKQKLVSDMPSITNIEKLLRMALEEIRLRKKQQKQQQKQQQKVTRT